MEGENPRSIQIDDGVRRFRVDQILEIVSEGFFAIDSDWRITYANRETERVVGKSREQLLGKDLRVEFPGEPAFLQRYAEVMRQRTAVEFEDFAPTLGFWFEVRAYPTDDGGVAVFFRDISERKIAQKELSDARDRLALALNAGGIGSFEWDFRHDRNIWSPELEKLYGLEPGTFGGTWDSFAALVVPEDLPHAVAAAQDSMRSGELRGEWRIRRANDSHIRWMAARGRVYRDANGQPARMIGVNVDITDRKRAEQELVQAKERAETSLSQLLVTIESMSEGVYIGDAQGAPLLVNNAFLRMYGLRREALHEEIEATGSFLEVRDMQGNVVPFSEWPINICITGRELLQYDLRVRKFGTDTEMIIRHNAVPVRDSNGKIIMAVVTVEDVTGMKQASDALIRSEKLASVGRMAATIAHEINNPLEAVMNFVYLAVADPAVPQPSRQLLQLAQQELQRVAHITRQTLGFYRENGRPERVNLAEVFDGVLDLYSPKLVNRSITVEKRFSNDCFAIGMAGELRQVISNLISNAIDALPESGGKLILQTSCATSKDGFPLVRLSIADNGCGIDPANRKKIFEPFFTTKLSVGTGLGLWVSQEIIKKHSGKIRVRSKPGHGTVVSLVLPAAPHELSSAA